MDVVLEMVKSKDPKETRLSYLEATIRLSSVTQTLGRVNDILELTDGVPNSNRSKDLVGGSAKKKRRTMIRQSPYKRVVVLALDEALTPTLDGFFASGASSFKAKAVVPTDSAPNWGSVLHGVLPEKHGLKNGDVEAGTPYDENSPYPSVYKLLAQSSKDIKLASYVAWEPINTGIIELSVKADLYAPLTHENAFWRWWLRFKHYSLKDSIYDYTVISRLLDYIRNPENEDVKLLLVHLTDVDEHGHGHGYGSQTYLNQIEIMDAHVAKILEAINEAGWKDDTLVIMTTDHGGVERGHGGSSDQEVNVFLAIRGAGIEPNSRIEGDVTNMDCAALILKALGMEIPEWFDAKLPVINSLSW
ncbi:14334_t:CDS:2 [Acaulospora morrowiae]|uniref:14334_t:CDS:1 n=1 Tax=Acaulospora morrowiae TaxID=94023 RepID=A0A9N9AXF1_9GLOM|nr:14334_t:CDS:2 [Acaulospora morrowiae]